MIKHFLFSIALFAAVVPDTLQAQNPGCFSPYSTYSVDFAPMAIVSADFNGDGNMDLATANVGTNNVSVMLGTGTGSFTPAVTFPAANGLYAMVGDDFNADGKIDLAMVNGGGYRLLLGTGTGSFLPPLGGGMARAPVDIVAGDFNGDGLPDFAVVNTIQNFNVGVKLNTGNGTFGPEVTYGCLGAQKITKGDFNNDGKLDLAVGRGGQSAQEDFSVLYGTGTGSFNTPVNYMQLGLYVSAITAADFNGDSRSDIAIASWNTNVVSVRLASGTNSFAPGTTYTVGTFPKAIVSADFNSDGKLDLATSNYSTNNISVLTATGSGTYSTSVNYSIGASPTGLVASDLNGDGKTDLAASVDYTAAVVLLNTVPILNPLANINSFCAGGTTTLQVSGVSSYTWTGGPTNSLYVVTPGVTTTYSVTGSNAAGCVSKAHTLTVTVLPLPPITYTISSAILCSGDLATAGASGASTYTWNTGAQTQTISFVASNSSSFSVSGTSTVTGCTATAPLQLTVSACTGIIESVASTKQLIIFPNSAKDNIEIKIADEELRDFNVDILTSLGQVVTSHCISYPNTIVDISSLKAGVYFVRVQNRVQKFVKE